MACIETEGSKASSSAKFLNYQHRSEPEPTNEKSKKSWTVAQIEDLGKFLVTQRVSEAGHESSVLGCLRRDPRGCDSQEKIFISQDPHRGVFAYSLPSAEEEAEKKEEKECESPVSVSTL